MKYIRFITIVTVCFIIAGCNVGKCNKSLLSRVIDTPASTFSDTYTLGAGAMVVLDLDSIIKSYSLGRTKWSIEPKGTGCLAVLSAEQNGEMNKAITFYIDLQKQEIYPGNQLADAVFIGIYQSNEVSDNGGLPLKP